VLAERLPGLRRVDLTVNYRCPAPVVERAVRLVARNRERFDKAIAPRTNAAGSLSLAALPTNDATRAQRVLARWVEEGLPDDGPATTHPVGQRWAVLARPNADLAPFAAVAVELGIPFSAEEHRLLLDDPRVDAMLEAAEAACGPDGHRYRRSEASAGHVTLTHATGRRPSPLTRSCPRSWPGRRARAH
jgi:superfamily I DNA/RNA helicase